MNVLIISFCLYIILKPFYVFSSGMPQPADFIFLVGVCYTLIQKNFWRIYSMSLVQRLAFFLLVVFLVNFGYCFVGLYYKPQIEYLQPILFYVFNGLCCMTAVYMFQNITHKTRNMFLLALILSLGIQCLLGSLGISKGMNETGERTTIFFNNPNQLGYYALLSLVFAASLYIKSKSYYIKLCIIVFLVMMLLLLSVSRAALGGFIVVLLYLLLKMNISVIQILRISVILLLIGVIFVTLNDRIIDDFVAIYEARELRDERNNISQAEIRGYDRIVKYPEYLFFGAGEDASYRFTKAHYQGELHSGFGTILFCYGIIGLTTFLLFIYCAIRRNFIQNMLLITPLIVYNITHQGLRTSLFWIIIAVIYVNGERQIYSQKRSLSPSSSTS